jgi:hypothetical protein
LSDRGRSGGDDVNIFGLDPGEDALALVEIGFGLAVVGENGAESESALDGDREFVHGPFEDFHLDGAWEGVSSACIFTGEPDFFRTEGEEDLGMGGRFWGSDIELETALESAMKELALGAEDFGFDDVRLADE